MPEPAIARPAPDEYAPYYAGYIARVTGDDALVALERQVETGLKFLEGIPQSKGGYRYAPEKWSVKEVIGHIVDTERIFTYRTLRIARGDQTPLPGFDEKSFVPAGRFDRRTLKDLSEEYADVRRATLSLLKRLDPEALARRGTANDKTVTPRAMAYITAGHEFHHLDVIRTRYL